MFDCRRQLRGTGRSGQTGPASTAAAAAATAAAAVGAGWNADWDARRRNTVVAAAAAAVAAAAAAAAATAAAAAAADDDAGAAASIWPPAATFARLIGFRGVRNVTEPSANNRNISTIPFSRLRSSLVRSVRCE